jgi:hypothetical protein
MRRRIEELEAAGLHNGDSAWHLGARLGLQSDKTLTKHMAAETNASIQAEIFEAIKTAITTTTAKHRQGRLLGEDRESTFSFIHTPSFASI